MNWFKNKKKTTAGGLVSLEFGPEGFALAYVKRDAEGVATLEHCQFVECPEAEQAQQLAATVKSLGLAGEPVNVVLHPATYQFLLLDRPEVPDEEVREALQWRLKDLIDDDPENVVFDVLSLPDDAYRGRAKMAYLVVIEKKRMQALKVLVREAGLKLAAIDITEMAFRNVGLLATASGVNAALLRLRSTEGVITVQQGEDLYMVRRIELGLNAAQEGFDNILLEVQRSIDYYESQIGKGAVGRLLLLPTKRDSTAVADALRIGLSARIDTLDLTSLFAAAPELDERTQAYCLAAVGGALRQEAVV
ncbi:MSHA biogenesis protein MshI [Atopomonas sediminilitoris]|uniref:MSHA biogenesis protein MshI n=1 Tax=Atopomonas sediminilitoris TaxID=2919919 RepID=UPI001F4DE9B8|nr:MSHA biogenesis protein MshI [Atopomonas sediminilitoris]MCJ8168399.1 MSHA biogenesis protein MshI [Atopomonas sediminilitoris]